MSENNYFQVPLLSEEIKKICFQFSQMNFNSMASWENQGTRGKTSRNHEVEGGREGAYLVVLCGRHLPACKAPLHCRTVLKQFHFLFLCPPSSVRHFTALPVSSEGIFAPFFLVFHVGN